MGPATAWVNERTEISSKGLAAEPKSWIGPVADAAQPDHRLRGQQRALWVGQPFLGVRATHSGSPAAFADSSSSNAARVAKAAETFW